MARKVTQPSRQKAVPAPRVTVVNDLDGGVKAVTVTWDGRFPFYGAVVGTSTSDAWCLGPLGHAPEEYQHAAKRAAIPYLDGQKVWPK